MLEDGSIENVLVIDKFADNLPDTTYYMTIRDQVVRVSNAGPIVVIVLPPVAQAKGKFYSIIARDIGAMSSVEIADREDSECYPFNLAMYQKCDGVLLYSDGLAWMVISLHGYTYVNTPSPTTEPAPTTGPE